VPVPVDDTAAEMVQMQLAAAAVIAVTVTKARIRRRYDRPAMSTVNLLCLVECHRLLAAAANAAGLAISRSLGRRSSRTRT
jgi:hypothetical protein